MNNTNENKFKNFFSSTTNLLCIAAGIMFIITVIALGLNVKSLFSKEESKASYLTDGSIKYMEIDDGYVVNELVLESGSVLPTKRDYFNENYKLSDDVSIKYFNMKNDPLNVDDFTVKIDNVYYVKGIQDIIVEILNNNNPYIASVSIQDTTTPEVTVKDLTVYVGDSYTPKDFIVSYVDNSSDNENYTTDFVGEYEFSDVGKHTVKIRTCDMANNCVETESTLTIEEKPVEKPAPPKDNELSSGSSGTSTTQSVSQRKPTNTNTGSNNNNNNTGNNNGNSSSGDSNKDYNSNNVNNATNSQKSNDPVFWERVEQAKAILNDPNNQSSINNIQQVFLTRTNKARNYRGVPELTLDYELCVLAQVRLLEYESLNWSESDATMHKRPDYRDFSTVFKDYGYVAGIYENNQRHYGENYVSVNGGRYYNNEGAYNLLENSPGHYANIVGRYYTKMGIARAQDKATGRLFWIQLFAS